MKTQKSRQTKNMKISKDKNEEFIDRIKNFEYLRQERTSRYQSIYLALLVSVIILVVDMIAGTDIFLKAMLIILLVIIAEVTYRKFLIQTQKPVFVCENAVGTIEKGPHYVKDKDGTEYAIFGLSDFKVKNDNPKK